MSGLQHHDAVVARLKARSGWSGSVFELGGVPKENVPPWYVVVASTPGVWSQARFTGGRTRLTTTHTVYCVATLARQALWVAQGVDAQCLNHRFAVTERTVDLPSEWISRPVVIDRDGLFPLPFAVIQFDLMSEPS